MRSLTYIDPRCHKCNGKCWKPGDQKATQPAAMKKFGTIPNHCVNGSKNKIMCPAALGLL